MEELRYLADLLHIRNATEKAITRIIGRPALPGHLGEFIAQHIFGIDLEENATHPGYDGRFQAGPLRGKTVNVKMYGKREGALDIKPAHVPDYYLVMTGPKSSSTHSKGQTRPWQITEVFLFDGPALLARLRARGLKHIGVATSITLAEWDGARIYPDSEDSPIHLSDLQVEEVQMFEE